jgi:hypothetical protein
VDVETGEVKKEPQLAVYVFRILEDAVDTEQFALAVKDMSTNELAGNEEMANDTTLEAIVLPKLTLVPDTDPAT